jgi:hypothetical protein
MWIVPALRRIYLGAWMRSRIKALGALLVSKRLVIF